MPNHPHPFALSLGFDAKRAAQNATGLGNYSRFIIDLLARHTDAKLTLYAPRLHNVPLLERLPLERCRLVGPERWIDRKLKSRWRTYGITRRLAADGVQIYHGLSNELPQNIRRARGVKTVVTIHDLLFLRFPQGYKAIDRWIYNHKFRSACRQADVVVAVSEFTKQEIIRHYRIPAERIKVVYQGCAPEFRQTASEALRAEARKNYALPERYVLYVGTIERRKNLMLLAQALGQLPPDVQVVAIGRRTPYADEVERYVTAQGLSDRIRMIHGVPFRLLPAVYQMATAFVYPSRCEGFGIPLLEALCSGVPAVGCTGSCLEEAGGPDSLYVDPDDATALAAAVEKIWTDESLRLRMIECGRAYAERFTDKRLLQDLLAVYSAL